MLSRLLAIKRQRERALRAVLAQLLRQQAELEARAQDLCAQRPVLQRAQRDLLAQSGCYSQQGLARLRLTLDAQRQQALAIETELAQLAQAQARLQAEHAAQSQGLRRVLVQQEKLRILMEQA